MGRVTKEFEAKGEDIERVADLIGYLLKDHAVPLPLGILAMEHLMDRVERQGFRFQRKKRKVFDVISNEGT